MTLKDLKKSPVFFNEQEHSYWLGEKQLQGITGMIHRQIFPDKYKGVKKEVLDNRAAFGHEFHKQMELYIVSGIESDSDMFRVFKENYGHIKFIASEYIVSDEVSFASAIDAVDEDCIIYDFKTSSKKDLEYWRWQLSVYRYLFKMQNGFAPKGAKVLWINKDLKHELVDIEFLPDDYVESLLSCEMSGKQFEMPKNENLVPVADVEKLALLEEQIANAESRLKQLKADRETFVNGVMALFQQHSIKSWETDRIKFTVKEGYDKTSVDSAALKTDYPDVWKKVKKTSHVKPSLIIKVKEVV